MGIFDNFVNKTLATISSVSEKINSSASNRLKKNVENTYDKLTIIYYKSYSTLKIYRAILSNKDNLQSERIKCDLEFDTLEDIEKYFSQYDLEIEYINVLSKDYVYVTKSGINTNGSDFRLNKDIVSDLLFYSIYSNGCLDTVDLVSCRVDLSVYKPFMKDSSKLNRRRWSYDIVSEYLNSGRIVSFLMSESDISYDYNLDKIITNPKELLFDLVALGKSNQLFVTDCGDLGIQISFK